jgi:hypothetical protein
MVPIKGASGHGPRQSRSDHNGDHDIECGPMTKHTRAAQPKQQQAVDAYEDGTRSLLRRRKIILNAEQGDKKVFHRALVTNNSADRNS